MDPIPPWIPPATVLKTQDGTILLIKPGRLLPLPNTALFGADTAVVHVLQTAGSGVKCNNYVVINTTLVQCPRKGKVIIYKSKIIPMLKYLLPK